jgi:lipoate-protein ligase A
MPNKGTRNDVCRLLVEDPAEGAWNMAVDEALLERAAEDGVPTLRIYRWQRPTLSLGYFQEHAQRHSHRESLDADVVRRLSGGGAILHDQEITYSLVLPSTHPLAADRQLLYNTVHQAIVEWLAEFAAMKESSWRLVLNEGRQQSVRREQPFLCFERRSPGDVLLVDDATNSVEHKVEHKIVGSAQRRRRGSVLQHGSILWSTSSFAQEIWGFANLTGESVSLAEAVKSFSSGVLTSLGLTGENSQLAGKTLAASQRSCAERYNLPAWTERR